MITDGGEVDQTKDGSGGLRQKPSDKTSNHDLTNRGMGDGRCLWRKSPASIMKFILIYWYPEAVAKRSLIESISNS